MNLTKKSNLFFLIVVLINIIGINLLAHFSVQGETKVLVEEILLILLPSLMYLRTIKQPFKKTIKLNKLSLRGLGLTCIISLVSFIFSINFSTLLEKIFYNYIGETVSVFQSNSLFIWILVLGVSPAICEEIFMRGAVLYGYKDMKLRKVAILNGFLFGIMHLNFHQFFYASIIGFIMVYLVYATNSILSSVIMHFMINTIFSILNWSICYYPNIGTNIFNFLIFNNKTLFQLLACIITGLILYAIIKKYIINNNKNIEINSNENAVCNRSTYYPIYISIIAFIIFNIFVFYI